MFGWTQSWPHQLRRAFDVIVFDWDGTAVAARGTKSHGLGELLEKLLSRDVICCVISDAGLQSIDPGMLGSLEALSAAAKQRLFLFPSRGSEVYSFGADGKLGLLCRKVATEEEQLALDRVIEALQTHFESRAISARVQRCERENSRAIEIQPEQRSSGEIRELLDEAKRTAEGFGLDHATITFDLRQIEIGLTNKGDSARWIKQHILQDGNIPFHQAVFIGDEFGSLNGLPGSDAPMRIPELKDAVYVSVGTELEGVPEKVLHIGGGPKRFLEFLSFQAQVRVPREQRKTRRSGDLLRLSADPAWLLKQEGFDPSQEREIETIFSMGNGCLGVRGSVELRLPAAQTDLFVGGVYSKKSAMIPYSELEFSASEGRDDPFSELVPFPSPFRIGLRVDGKDISFETTRVRNHERVLDFRHGLLFQTFTFEDSEGRRTRLQTIRCVSLADSNLLLHEIEVVCENHSSRIELELSPEVMDPELRYPHLKPLPFKPTEKEQVFSQIRIFDTGSPFYVCVATRAFTESAPITDAFVSAVLREGEPFRVRRFISVSAKKPPEELVAACRRKLFGKSWNRFERDLDLHEAKWETFWKRCDLRFKQEPSLTQAQRFNTYHLRISADHDPEASIPAKALTGRAYEGHIFWDTEIFLLPFFAKVQPDIARNILMYRYHTLGGARRRALSMGCKGACYAWESTVTGDDVTPRSITIQGVNQTVPIFTGEQQIHVTADVVYGVWKYWEATKDRDFMIRFGAEILFETSRFWSSRAKPGADGKLHILGVVGPDEYHSGVNDNAFTNWMARFNLKQGVWAAEWLKEEHPGDWERLQALIGLTDEEVSNWSDDVKALFVPEPGKDGVIEQFEGFFALKEVELGKDERNKAPVSRLFKWQEVNRMKLIKQADVLMIPFLFPGALPREIVDANYRYYERLTDHGSSLSPSVHAAIAAQVGDHESAFRYWEQSIYLDLRNIMHNTGLGIHIACIGGAWQALVIHMLGGKALHGEIQLADIRHRRAA